MKRVAIVGVEGSGKTVLLAGLGELYSRPDNDGYFLTPKNFATASYVADKIDRMRSGEWPAATAEDVLQGLNWTLKRKNPNGGRPAEVCAISCLDFAGEVYRNAFGISAESGTVATEEASELKRHIRAADYVIVLVNLRDIITSGIRNPRVQESIWITRSILQFALDELPDPNGPRAALVLTQADSYADTIEACGGVWGVLKTHLRDVANNYDWLDAFAVSSVDRTVLDNDGNVIPAKNFTLNGLQPIVNWILENIRNSPASYQSSSTSSRAHKPKPVSKPVAPARRESAPKSSEQAGPPRRRAVNATVFRITVAIPAVFAVLCLLNRFWWSAGLMACLMCVAYGSRDNDDWKQGAGWWLLWAFLLFVSGCLALSGHGWLAFLCAVFSFCCVDKRSGKSS